MSKRLKCKYKFDQRIGENLWGHKKSPLNRSSFIKKKTSRHSDYGIHLLAKQKIRYYYDISEKQLRKIYKIADASDDDTSKTFLTLLESRLVTIVYRLKFASTIFAARQMVSHGHILVNGRTVTIPSYTLALSMKVSVSKKVVDRDFIREATKREDIVTPLYLSVDYDKFVGHMTRVPKLKEIPYGTEMEPNLVVEFYSK